MKLLITCGAGFIGSAVIRHIIQNTQDRVINIDKLTYAGNLESLRDIEDTDRYAFEQVDICISAELERVFAEYLPDMTMHFAAESHVDRSIDGSVAFIETNIVGTYTLRGLHYQIKQPQSKLVRVARGEVFGVAVDLRANSPTFGQWVGEYPSEDDFCMLWVPPGFAHGFLVTSETSELQYKCTDFYAPKHESSIHWADDTLAIEWPIPEGITPIISVKDRAGFSLQKAENYKPFDDQRC